MSSVATAVVVGGALIGGGMYLSGKSNKSAAKRAEEAQRDREAREAAALAKSQRANDQKDAFYGLSSALGGRGNQRYGPTIPIVQPSTKSFKPHMSELMYGQLGPLLQKTGGMLMGAGVGGAIGSIAGGAAGGATSGAEAGGAGASSGGATSGGLSNLTSRYAVAGANTGSQMMGGPAMSPTGIGTTTPYQQASIAYMNSQREAMDENIEREKTYDKIIQEKGYDPRKMSFTDLQMMQIMSGMAGQGGGAAPQAPDFDGAMK